MDLSNLMRNKRFDNALKEKHDAVGKALAEEIMKDVIGAKLITNNDKEDAGDFSDGFWDQLYEMPSGKQIKVEPEMKDSKWWGTHHSPQRPFRYNDMDIPYRKAKNSAHAHIVISTCRSLAFVVTRKAMDDHLEQSGGQPKVKKTIYEPNGAPYFSTPVSKGYFVQKHSDGKWRTLKRG